MKDPKANNRTGFSEIESIDLPNELTAIVHYKSIYAPYPLNFFSLMPKAPAGEGSGHQQDGLHPQPLGTGPFKITDFKTDESITLEKNTNYRDTPDKPYLDKIIFKSVPLEPGRARAAQGGRGPRDVEPHRSADARGREGEPTSRCTSCRARPSSASSSTPR